MEVVFWVSVGFVVYAYVGYPLALKALSGFRDRPVRKGDITPTVSFIIAAHNEEKRIREKLQNTLGQNYPAEKIEIIVASDGSTDRTNAIVRSYERRSRIRLVATMTRRGKEAAQKRALDEASGDIVVFSDVATMLSEDGVSNIVRNFHDPTVGCVSSMDRVIGQDGQLCAEGVYVTYEMLLRRLETRVNTLVGLSGSFFAARRAICGNWRSDLQSDFSTLLNAVKNGMRGILDDESVGYYRNLVDERREYERKTRTVLRGIAVFMESLALLNPLRYGLFSWQLFSHKLCRWLVPFFMMFVFISNVFVFSSSALYRYSLLLQIGFYVLGLSALWLTPKLSLLRVPCFFLLANASILEAWYRYCRGDRIMGWRPSERY